MNRTTRKPSKSFAEKVRDIVQEFDKEKSMVDVDHFYNRKKGIRQFFFLDLESGHTLEVTYIDKEDLSEPEGVMIIN